MAMAQAELVAELLHADGGDAELVPLTTSGDRWSGDLAVLGGKGAFVKEIDRGLLDGEADVAVHCLKDIPGDVPIPDGLVLAAYLPREDSHDAVVAPAGTVLPNGLDSLPAGAVVGTSAVRRQAQLRGGWPALAVKPIRGNANSRLAKLDAGEYDALLLAGAGLRRIGAADRISAELTMRQMLPAIGAGQLVLAVRADDPEALTRIGALDDPESRSRATAERAMLARLGGDCHSPIAGHAAWSTDGTLTLHAAVYSLDGQRIVEALDSVHLPGGSDPVSDSATTTDTEAHRLDPVAAAEALGARIAERLISDGAHDLISPATGE